MLESAHQLGIPLLTGCRKNRLYFVQGELTAEQVSELGRHLLADPVIESFSVHQIGDSPQTNYSHTLT
jgi:hypothetical protein